MSGGRWEEGTTGGASDELGMNEFGRFIFGEHVSAEHRQLRKCLLIDVNFHRFGVKHPKTCFNLMKLAQLFEVYDNNFQKAEEFYQLALEGYEYRYACHLVREKSGGERLRGIMDVERRAKLLMHFIQLVAYSFVQIQHQKL